VRILDHLAAASSMLASPSLLLAAALLVSGCALSVEVPGDSTSGGDTSGGDGSGGDSSSTSSGSTSGGGGGSFQGVPCKYLHGQATLTSYTDPDNYVSSAYSFEMASQDEALTKNDWDVLYENDTFVVNTVGDDVSFIVDLGAVALADVPATVDPSGFPTGQFGEHDAIQAVAAHTYVVRTIDDDTRQYAAFRVVALSPGSSVTMEWMCSTDPETLTIPAGCGL
jgi:hypothetical protein